MSFGVDILTLFPEFFRSPLQTSLLARAQDEGVLDVGVLDIRDFTRDKHRRTDDQPYGGGAGMVMRPEPLVRSLEYARERRGDAPRILLTPQGEPFSQEMAADLAKQSGMILTCGRYEGVDERVRDGWIDRELSVGDYVLSGGESAALVVLEAVMRLLPDALGNDASLDEESFESGGLEYPQYTRPREFRGMEVPDVLLSGDHGRIREWREARAEERTRRRRPDLLDDDADEGDDP